MDDTTRRTFVLGLAAMTTAGITACNKLPKGEPTVTETDLQQKLDTIFNAHMDADHRWHVDEVRVWRHRRQSLVQVA